MKKNNIAISVNNVSVSYRIISNSTIKRIPLLKLRKKERFVALKNVTFNINAGSITGIIGRNGSGKSTLLNTISGVFKPDTGTINLYNNTISLMSIGVGFNRTLSGYENIYLSGLLLGFSEEYIKSKEKEIIEFSELGDFIYKPVKTYSSGMYSKLAFSIYTILETDIILIDEVLSVGDINFREKSYNKMKEIIKSGSRTVLIVSHSISTIQELCDTVIWLHDGKLIMQDKTDKVLKEYTKFMKDLKNKKISTISY